MANDSRAAALFNASCLCLGCTNIVQGVPYFPAAKLKIDWSQVPTIKRFCCPMILLILPEMFAPHSCFIKLVTMHTCILAGLDEASRDLVDLQERGTRVGPAFQLGAPLRSSGCLRGQPQPLPWHSPQRLQLEMEGLHSQSLL